MSRPRIAAIALALSAVVAAGCGGSTKSSSQTTTNAASQSSTAQQVTAGGKQSTPSGPLTRAQLIAKGEAICYRLNVRRSSTRISKPGDYERLIPALAAYELAAATEMGELIPPASMARDWKRMVEGSHTVAEATGRFSHYSEAGNDKMAKPFDIILGHGIEELTHAAKRAGFKECAVFK